MKLELLIMTPCSLCDQARMIWSKVANETGIQLDVIDIAEPMGEGLMNQHALKTIPAIFIDGKLRAIGVQNEAEAAHFLKQSV